MLQDWTLDAFKCWAIGESFLLDVPAVTEVKGTTY